MISQSDTLMKEIDKALRFSRRFDAALTGDFESRGLLLALKESIAKTDAAMSESGVVAACSLCAAKTGSCCFREMGESYGALTLLVNLLLGSELPKEPVFPGGCRFVGERGCRLQARQSFCLNYFCPDLERTLGVEEVSRIQKLIGDQLIAGWELERTLARCIANAEKREQAGNIAPE